MNTVLSNIINNTDYDFRRPLELNLANREHADYIEKIFEGKDYFKEQYPDLYRLFPNGAAHAAVSQNAGMKADEQQGSSYCRIAAPGFGFFKNHACHRSKRCQL